jgi:5'-nucleotidase
MDGVIANLNAAFEFAWASRYPHRALFPESVQLSPRILDGYPDEYRGDIYTILSSPGFTQSMPEIPGAIEAIQAMALAGFQVYICTSPLRNYLYNVSEKFAWVDEHLGRKWVQRLVITRDKTVVRGRYLIDDALVVRGAVEPEWEHIIFDKLYNRDSTIPNRRINWDNWREILL